MPAIKPGQYLTGYSGVTPSDVEKYMKASFDAADTEVCEEAIKAVEMEISRLTDRNFAYIDGTDKQQYYQVFDGGHYAYDLAAYPLDEIVKIEIDGTVKYDVDDETKPYVLGTDFYTYDEMIEFPYKQVGGLSNRNVVKIYWTMQQFWGDDIRLAVKKWVADIMRDRATDGKTIKKFSFSGLTYEYENKDTKTILDHIVTTYKRPIV